FRPIASLTFLTFLPSRAWGRRNRRLGIGTAGAPVRADGAPALVHPRAELAEQGGELLVRIRPRDHIGHPPAARPPHDMVARRNHLPVLVRAPDHVLVAAHAAAEIIAAVPDLALAGLVKAQSTQALHTSPPMREL